MPPRVRLSSEEAERLPALLARVPQLRMSFPIAADPARQAAWVRAHYSDEMALSLNLTTLLLFEHGVHRSVEQVTRDLAILPEEPIHERSERSEGH